METQYLKSSDGIRIAYDYWTGNENGVLLVHQLPSNRKSWSAVAPQLSAKGYSVMAIDYRGRGESGGQLATPSDFQNIALDIDAALEFMRTKGVKRTVIIGASIGANHALLAAERHNDVTGAVLLSPGLDYRGVTTESAAMQKPLLIAASEDDEYAVQSARRLHELAKKSEIIMFKAAGHGTDMFREKELAQKLADFISKVFENS